MYRIGETRMNNLGSIMVIYEYITCRNIKVKFVDFECIVPTTYQNFLNGKVKNPYDRSVLGVGYLGEGEYTAKINGIETRQYRTWMAMLSRCYDENFHKRQPAYIGCTVYREWHSFQNFAKWFDENYYEIDKEKVDLDKDILIKGNKIYSPDTCVFVPERINTLFIKNNANRGNLPIGVKLNKTSKNPSFEAKCKDENGDTKFLGCFDTPEKAFNKYKIYKEFVINKIAKKYKDLIPDRLYNAMTTYKVSITD